VQAWGFYLMPYCDPGYCEPDGPFPKAGSVRAYSLERAPIKRQELVAPKAAEPTPNFCSRHTRMRFEEWKVNIQRESFSYPEIEPL
jgi:hypothetical protein